MPVTNFECVKAASVTDTQTLIERACSTGDPSSDVKKFKQTVARKDWEISLTCYLSDRNVQVEPGTQDTLNVYEGDGRGAWSTATDGAHCTEVNVRLDWESLADGEITYTFMANGALTEPTAGSTGAPFVSNDAYATFGEA